MGNIEGKEDTMRGNFRSLSFFFYLNSVAKKDLQAHAREIDFIFFGSVI